MKRAPERTGRAVSAGIVVALRDALAGGRAMTYAELARAARCAQRTVRNYVDDGIPALGFEVERTRGMDHAIRVRRVGETDAAPSIEAIGRALAAELLRSVFPIAGTSLDVRGRRAPVPVVVSTRGAYEYREAHLQVLRRWLQVVSARPRRALQFRYDSFDSGISQRIVWPLGIVLRDAARVYLAGIPAEARDARDVRTYALEFIVFPRSGSPLQLLDSESSGAPPQGIEGATIEESIDAPFSMFRPSPERSVRVRVEVSAREARYVVGRRWHKRQRLTRKADGRVILELGPADRHEVEAWLRGLGDGARLLEMVPPPRRRAGR